MKPVTRMENLLKEFIFNENRNERIARLFDFADERGRSGFEKWVQFEIVLFLHGKGYVFGVEQQVKVDGITPGKRAVLQTDLEILIGEKVYALELKVRRHTKRAITVMSSDLAKFANIRPADKAHHNFAIALVGDDIGPDDAKAFSDRGGRVITIAERCNFLLIGDGV